MANSRSLARLFVLIASGAIGSWACGSGGDPGTGSGGSGPGGAPATGGRGGRGGASATGGSAGSAVAGSGGSGVAGSGGGGSGGSAGAGGSGVAGAGGSGAAGSGGSGGSAGGGAMDAAGEAGPPATDASGGAGGSAGAGGAGGAGGASGGGGAPAGPNPGPGWMMRWSGNATSPGLELFEGQETSECSHNVPHVSVMGGHIRVDSHYPMDTDCNGRSDRARNEVKGMRAQGGGGYVSMRRGETWLLQYDMFIPDTLDATTQFSHIYQIFSVTGTSAVTGPIVTMTLHSHGGTDSIELRIDGASGAHFSPVPLAPIQNKWVTVEHEMKWDGGGYYRWSIKEGERVHVNATRMGWNGWHGAERMRPKWGIYRNKGSAGLQTTHLLLNNFRAYQKTGP